MRLRAENISIRFHDRPILENISFTLEKKELVMLLGMNGAGKTTLLRILTGLLSADAGHIFYNERNITDISYKERARQVAYIPQECQSVFEYTAEDFIYMGVNPYLHFFEVPGRKYKEMVERALTQFSITALRFVPMRHLSGGEKKLVYLARAMVQRAGMMVLDEPTSALDYQKQHLFLQKLKEYIALQECGAIMSVHDPNLAIRYADRILILNDAAVFSDLNCRKKDFVQEFFFTLNHIYGGRLKLCQSEADTFISWGEE